MDIVKKSPAKISSHGRSVFTDYLKAYPQYGVGHRFYQLGLKELRQHQFFLTHDIATLEFRLALLDIFDKSLWLSELLYPILLFN